MEKKTGHTAWLLALLASVAGRVAAADPAYVDLKGWYTEIDAHHCAPGGCMCIAFSPRTNLPPLLGFVGQRPLGDAGDAVVRLTTNDTPIHCFQDRSATSPTDNCLLHLRFNIPLYRWDNGLLPARALIRYGLAADGARVVTVFVEPIP